MEAKPTQASLLSFFGVNASLDNAGKKQARSETIFNEPATKKPIFEKAALKSQNSAGLGRLTGNQIGGAPGRKVKRDWEASALAMPWPLSEVNKEQLRTTYVQGYAALDIEMTHPKFDFSIWFCLHKVV